MPTQVSSPREVQRSFVLGAADGVLYRLFMALTDPAFVLTWFVSQLSTSSVAVGMLLPIRMGASVLPQLFFAGWVQRRPRKMPVYRALMLVSLVCWALLIISVFVLGDTHKSLLLIVFVVLFCLYSMITGVVGLPFMDIVARVIPPRRRASFFACLCS